MPRRKVVLELTVPEAHELIEALFDWKQFTTPEKFGWKREKLLRVGRAAQKLEKGLAYVLGSASDA